MMTIGQAIRRCLVAACTLVVVLAGGPVQAQTPPQSASDDWRFWFILYGWFPSIGGTTSFSTGGISPSVNVDASTILDHLQFAFMGAFEARKGRWGVFADYDYMNLSADKSATRDFSFRGYPVGALTADLSYDLKGNVLTLTGLYGLSQTPDVVADLLFGARMLNLKQTLGFTFNGSLASIPLLTRSGGTDLNFTNWDAIVGVKGRVRFGDGGHWYLPYYADIGTGQSKLTWQAMAGIGYSWNSVELLAVWRYLDYDFKSSSQVDSLTLNGPAVGIVFKW
ncbi:MAG TPA: hypothetical protein VMK32_01790 [Burkholderiaceae bacterium]|nr:hypothetical protein [Burkholderiaceae bacterium]